MTDKERILMLLVQRILSAALYAPEKVREWMHNQPGIITHDPERELKVGDLVVASTSFEANDFLVGFVHEPPDRNGTVVIREIGSNRLCNYGNEMFMRIPKDLIGEEIYEGLQYQTVVKARKAFAKAAYPYTVRYAGCEFTDHFVLIKGRKVFSEEIVVSFSMPYSSKTSIKSIVKRINEEYTEHLRKEKETE